MNKNKYIFNLFFLFIFVASPILVGATGGGGNPGLECIDASPFCSDEGYNFPNITDGTIAPTGPNYGCNPGSDLPNPIWYYMEVAVAGVINITISQSTGENGTGMGLDVDYVMWGPFTSFEDGCTAIMSGQAPPAQASWSPAATENISIGGTGGSSINADLHSNCTQAQAQQWSQTTLPPAQVGEVYIIVMSNWDGQSGYYTFEQTNYGNTGAGSTDCSIVEPMSCDNWVEVDFEGFEDNPNTPIPGLDGNKVFHDSPQSNTLAPGIVHTGNYAMYMNIKENESGLLYTKEYTDLCEDNIYRISFWSKQLDSPGTDNMTFNVKDQNGDVLVSLDVIGQAAAWEEYMLDFITTGSTVQFEIVTNIPGSAGGNDVCFDDLKLQGCFPKTPIVSVTDPTCDADGVVEITNYLDYSVDYEFTETGPTVNPTSHEVEGLVLGQSYEVVSLNEAGCPSEPVTFTVEEQLESPTYTVSITDPNCGHEDGEIVITPNTGFTLTGYSIDNGTTTQPDGTFSNLGAGSYSILVIADNGCEASSTEELVDVVGVSVDDITITDPSCSNDDGVLVVQVSGGTAPYTFVWTDNEGNEIGTEAMIDGLSSGTYNVEVSDENGCAVTESATLAPPPPLDDPSFEYEDFCEGDVNGPSNVVTPGGVFSMISTDGATVDPLTGILSDGVPATTYSIEYTIVGDCPVSHTVEVTIFPLPAPSFIGSNLYGCKPLEVSFENTSTDTEGMTCLWDFGDGTTSEDCASVIDHTYESSGIYTVSLTLTSDFGCTETFTENDFVEVIPGPEAIFIATPMVVTTEDPEVTFINNSTNATSYTWDFGDSSAIETSYNTTHSYPKDNEGSYVVTLVAYDGDDDCNDTMTVVITVNQELIFYVPNSFTPDGDNFNELFKPIFNSGYDPQTYTLSIYNRWGEILFESHDVNVGWDGTYGLKKGGIIKDGVYLWKIKIKEAGNDKHNEYVGHVTLLR